MVQLIVGNKGKGKTKHLLEKVNLQVKETKGNIVYLDKSTKHMYELNNKVRLIDVSQYMITNHDEFVGFICGIVSQDHDLEEMYLDSFLTIASVETDDEICHAIQKLDIISEKYNDYAQKVVNFLNNSDIRTVLDDRNEKIGRKIRDNELKKIPYMLIVGEQEMNENKVSVRRQGEGDKGSMTTEEFAEMINKEVEAQLNSIYNE